MLLTGVDGVSVVAQSAQLAIYTILAVPLILAVDMRALSSASHALLPNSDVIASHEARTGVRLEVPPSRSERLSERRREAAPLGTLSVQAPQGGRPARPRRGLRPALPSMRPENGFGRRV